MWIISFEFTPSMRSHTGNISRGARQTGMCLIEEHPVFFLDREAKRFIKLQSQEGTDGSYANDIHAVLSVIEVPKEVSKDQLDYL